MDIKKIILDVEQHPFIVAVAIFLIFFIGYNVLKKKSNSTATVPTPGYKGPQSETFNYFPPGTLPTGVTVPPPQPTPVAPVLPIKPIPIMPPTRPVCDIEKFHGCIYDYNVAHPHHKGHAAHKYCWGLMPECQGVN